MARLQDDKQKPLNQVSDELLFKYYASLSNSDFVRVLMKNCNNLTIEKLAELSNVSVSLIKKLLYDNDYCISKRNLQRITLYGFALSLDEAELLFNAYGFTIKLSKQKRDMEFRKKLKIREPFTCIDFSHLSKDDRKDYILKIIKIYNSLQQSLVADILKISRRTVCRLFRELSIINTGSRKNPKWKI